MHSDEKTNFISETPTIAFRNHAILELEKGG
jgi:hypothetical protein